jgi:murein DD-endopeptidase MepM/ murein hydrolase activator NlpD
MEKRNRKFAEQLRNKQQASASLLKPKTMTRIGHALLLASLSFACFVASDWPQENAKAQEVAANQVATGSTWQGASFPVENFQAYTSAFGYRQSPSGYSQEFHHGLDMAAPEGSYIRSWWNGTVVEVSDDSACGTSVVVQSGEWEHIYCHMQGHVETTNGKRYMVDREGGLQMAEGQQVIAGTRIGRVGMTGRTTGPHLHWGMKYSGQWVDPALVLRAMYAQQTASRSVSSRPN